MKINPVTNNREISITQSFGDTNTKLNTIFSISDTTKTKEIAQTGLILENEKVPPKGSNSPEHLKNAPSPIITVAGEEKFASIVVDTKHNLLYKYNDKGEAEMVYSVATGKKRTPTRKGI